MRVSILIPVYNEAPTLLTVLGRVKDAMLPPHCTKEIIIIDDGSMDETKRLIESLASPKDLKYIRFSRNRGKGAAIRAGLVVATGDVILIQDGDLEYNPEDYLSLINPIVLGKADAVYGSRFRGSTEGMTWLHRIANFILTSSTNVLYKAHVSDQATAYKAFRADVLASLNLECKRFEFCSEVTAKLCRLGYKIREVPVRYQARTVSQGKKIRARDGIVALWTLVKFRFTRLESVRMSSQPQL